MAPQKGVETNAPKHEFAFHTVSSLLGVSARAGCQSDSKREFQSELCSENSQVMGKVKQSCETCNTKDHVPANKAPLFYPRSEVVGRNVVKGKPPFDGLAMEFARRRVLTPSNAVYSIDSSNKPLEWTGLHLLSSIALEALPATQGQRSKGQLADHPDASESTVDKKD